MENIIPHNHKITFEDRVNRSQYRPKLIWFTGYSGSGKSTLASELENRIFQLGCQTYILDGDNIRFGLNKDLDFSDSGRKENIRRISEVAKLFLDAGVVVMTAFISPFIQDRETAKRLVGAENFMEVYVECSLEECERRDVKGLYKKARNGEIPNFTGITSPFEEPENPFLKVNTEKDSIEDCVSKLFQAIIPKIKSNEAL